MAEYGFTQELGLTHAEFFKSLPAAIEHREFHKTGSGVRIDYDDGRQVLIELGPQQVRKIALLRMPYCSVAFRFVEFGEDQRQAFMHRFDLYFRRGGG